MRRRGFTLIETLIATAVLSVGLFGAATLLLSSLRAQARSQREIAAVNLLRELAERIRVNPRGRASYAIDAAAQDCRAQACDATQLAAADRAYFFDAARELVPAGALATIEFAPATGANALDRYVLTLGPSIPGEDGGVISVQLLLRAPVAG